MAAPITSASGALSGAFACCYTVPRMPLRFALLFLLLPCCGRTDRDASPATSSLSGSSGAGSGGSASSGASGASAASGAGGVPEPSCLFPVLPGRDFSRSTDKPPTRYVLTQPYRLDELAPHHRFAAAYEVNGDGVSDLLLLDEQASPPRFRLLLTSPPPTILDLVDSDCAALRELPGGRLLLRDLDGDGVQDFVVGTKTGVQGFLNRPEGLRRVLDYSQPNPTERAPLLNLGMTDLNGDDQSDLVISFDRLISEASLAFELRMTAFMQVDGKFVPGSSLATGYESGMMRDETGTVYTGYLAAGQFQQGEQGSALLIGQTPSSSAFRFALQSRFDDAPPVPLLSPFGQQFQQVFAVPRADAHTLALAVGETKFFLLDLDGPAGESGPAVAPSIVAEGELSYLSGPTHELGGGGESPRYFLYDIDRDGDLDFLERDPLGPRLMLHVFRKQSFDEGQVLDVDISGSAETPFMDFGPEGAIIGHTEAGGDEAAVFLFVGTFE